MAPWSDGAVFVVMHVRFITTSIVFPWVGCFDVFDLSSFLVDAAARSEEWESRDGTNDRGRVVPLLMMNKVPDGFETDDRLDVQLRPDEVCSYPRKTTTQFADRETKRERELSNTNKYFCCCRPVQPTTTQCQ